MVKIVYKNINKYIFISIYEIIQHNKHIMKIMCWLWAAVPIDKVNVYILTGSLIWNNKQSYELSIGPITIFGTDLIKQIKNVALYFKIWIILYFWDSIIDDQNVSDICIIKISY